MGCAPPSCRANFFKPVFEHAAWAWRPLCDRHPALARQNIKVDQGPSRPLAWPPDNSQLHRWSRADRSCIWLTLGVLIVMPTL
jgi:hypothetical protein